MVSDSNNSFLLEVKAEWGLGSS